MRVRWRLGLALLTAASLPVAAPALAHAGPRVVVEKTRAFPVAATGGRAHLRAVVTNTGDAPSKPSRVTVILLRPGAKPRRLAATGTAFPARDPGRSRTVIPTAALPADVPAGSRVRLRVCVPASCKATDEVLIAGATGGQLVDTAESTGAIMAGDAALFRMRSAWGDPRLPEEYRVTSRDFDDHAAVVESAWSFQRVSDADQARVLPYFLPAAVRDALAGKARAAATGDGDPCAGIRDAWKEGSRGLSSIAAAGGKVRVWYRRGHASGARVYASAFDVAWPKLTRRFRAPLPNRAGCVPPTGRLNVFVEPRAGFFRPNAGLTAPIPVRQGHGWRTPCTRTPTFITIEEGTPRVVVPHELMHAIQFAYRYSACHDEIPLQNRWWDEGGATWAGDFVFPDDDYEHRYRRAFTANWPIWAEGYDAWPFWYFLTQTNGVRVMRKVFAALATTRPRAAVDVTIPGGFARQYPLYLRWLRNAVPVGAPGFPLERSFAALDGLRARPAVAVDRALGLDGLPERTVVVPALAPGEAFCSPRERLGAFSIPCDVVRGAFAPQTRVYQHFTIDDPNLRELRFQNGLVDKPGERVEAWLRLAGGNWKTADWSGPETTLCRDLPDEDVSEVWVVETNVGVNGDGFPARGARNRVRGRDHCSLTSFDGTFSGTAHVVSDSADTTTGFHGTLRLDPGSSSTEWKIGPSTLSVDSMSGTIGGCAASIDPTSFAMPTPAQEGPAMTVANGEYTLFAGAPEDDQLTVHLSGSGCTDAQLSLGQFVRDIARSDAPVAPQQDGTIAGSATLAPSDGVTEQLSFSLAPVP